MVTRRNDLFVAPAYRDPIEGRRIGTRLDHEHDMVDAFWTRMDDHQKMNVFLKSMEKKSEVKWHHRVGMMLLFCNVYFVAMVVALKLMRIL